MPTPRKPAPMPTALLLQLEQMRHNTEGLLRRAEERAVRYRLQLDALSSALDTLDPPTSSPARPRLER